MVVEVGVGTKSSREVIEGAVSETPKPEPPMYSLENGCREVTRDDL